MSASTRRMPRTVEQFISLIDGASDRSRPLIEDPERFVSVQKIQDWLQAFRYSRKGNQLKGKCCAVQLRNHFERILALLLLDGWVESMLLLPAGIPDAQISDFQRKSGCGKLFDSLKGFTTAETSDVRMAPFGPGFETRWIIPTSGTTGTPKLVLHSLATLMRTAKRDHTKGCTYKWGLLYDPYRFAGLQVVLQALGSGSSVAIGDALNLEGSIEFFADRQINALSATPTLWRRILMTADHSRLQLKQITLGGEIADPGILKALRSAYPDARIVHIYASTETGVGFSVTDELSGFPETYVQEGTANGTRLRVSGSGELLIKPNGSAPHILREDTAFAHDGFIPTGDFVEKRSNRYIFLGRGNGSINVGGNKVMPEEVESVLGAVTGVAFARVRGKSNPITGKIVEAEIVPSTHEVDKQLLRKDLLAACREGLAPYKIPALIRFVDKVEVSSSGKIQRNAQQ